MNDTSGPAGYLPNVDPSRAGDWIQTYTGRCFWPLDPRPEDIDIEDIAHALSMICRYAGHSKFFYSVAEHSLLVSRCVPPEDALWGLLHDAAEAYSADIPRPIKRNLPGWKATEDNIQRAVCQRFGLPFEQPKSVRDADYAILADEQAALMQPCARDWGLTAGPLGVPVCGWAPARIESAFHDRFQELTS